MNSTTATLPTADSSSESSDSIKSSNSGRIAEINNALQTIFDAYEAWNISDVDYFPQSFETAISAGLNVILNNDIPASMIAVFSKCVHFGEIWAGVLAGEQGLADEQGMPARPFWDALHALREVFEKREVVERKGIEPVSDLLKQLKDHPHKHEQIARMYGKYNAEKDRYEGPFFYSSGTPNISLIEQEGKFPGSVIPKGYNPLAEKQKEARLAGISALAQVRKKLAEASGAPIDKDPASIEELLREGAFPDQIAMVKGCTEAHVREVAAKMGFTIQEREDILNAAYEAQIKDSRISDQPYLNSMNSLNSDELQELDADEPVLSENINIEDDSNSDSDSAPDSSSGINLTGEDLAAFVEIAFSENPDVTTAQVRAMIEADGQTASPIAIGRAISKARQSSNA